jgi:hypothetical protein
MRPTPLEATVNTNGMNRTRLLSRSAEFLILSLACAIALWGARNAGQGDHANSRLATVYSLSHYGTFCLDRPAGEEPIRFEQWTIDKVMVGGTVEDDVVRGGRLISSKPPILPLIMTAEYVALRAVTGWSLDDEAATGRIVYVMTATLMGGGYLLTLVFFLKTLRLFATPAAVGVVLTAALAFGTQLLGFSMTINNHVPAAGLLMVTLYYALGLLSRRLSPVWWRFALFGFAGGLAPTIDMPIGLFGFLAGIALLWTFPKTTLLVVAPVAILPLALHAAVLFEVTGSPFPVQVHKATYQYETSYWRHPLGIDGLNEPKPSYLFHILLGRCGVFLLYPILLLGVFSAFRAMFDRSWPARTAILTGGFAVGVLTAYYVISTNNYGGESYGFRWFIGAMPVLLLMGAPVAARAKNMSFWLIMIALLGVSFYSGWQCSTVGWRSGQEWTSRLFGPAYQQLPESNHLTDQQNGTFAETT